MLENPAIILFYICTCLTLSVQSPSKTNAKNVSLIYEGYFKSNVTVPVTSLCMIQFSKRIPHFVQLYISYKIVKSETKYAC